MDRHLTAIRMRVNRAEYPSRYTGWRKDKRISVLRDMKWLIKRIDQLEALMKRYSFEDHPFEGGLNEKVDRATVTSNIDSRMRRDQTVAIT
jgi:hypothetical protein